MKKNKRLKCKDYSKRNIVGSNHDLTFQLCFDKASKL